MPKKNVLTILPLLLVLPACAHNMKKQCAENDYYKMGLEDGKDGKSRESLAKAQEECSREGEVVSADKYEYGYKVGLAEYCDQSRGKSDAKDLKPNAICLQEKVPEYARSYNLQIGEEQRKREKELQDVIEKKDKLQARQNELQSDMNQIGGQRVPE